MNTQNKPSYEKRIGSIRVAVWENANNGGTWYNVSITRHYKDGDDWKETSTYNGLSDLALLREAVEVAREWIRKQELGDAGNNSQEAFI